MFSLIAAVGKNGELGKQGQLCFHLPEDLKWFKQTTLGHPVVMGRKTWASLPGKLPGRRNLVVTTHPDRLDPQPDATITDLAAFLRNHAASAEEFFIIGGGQLYAAALPHCQKLYLTEVQAADPAADTFFPHFDPTHYTKSTLREGSDHGVSYAQVLYTKQ